MGQYSFW